MKLHPMLAVAFVIWGAVSWFPTLALFSAVWFAVPLMIVWGVVYVRRRMTAGLALWQWVSIVACSHLSIALFPEWREQFEPVLLVAPLFFGALWLGLWMLPFGIASTWLSQAKLRKREQAQ